MSKLLECGCYKVEETKATKSHRCDECRKVIKKGEAYHCHYNASGGAPDFFTICLNCNERVFGYNLNTEKDTS